MLNVVDVDKLQQRFQIDTPPAVHRSSPRSTSGWCRRSLPTPHGVKEVLELLGTHPKCTSSTGWGLCTRSSGPWSDQM